MEVRTSEADEYRLLLLAMKQYLSALFDDWFSSPASACNVQIEPRNKFDLLDTDGDGRIAPADLARAVHAMGIIVTEAELTHACCCAGLSL